ncbi:hypothetical protein V1515DRAFT_607410 [Lipomyces mesembrius]
MALSPTISADMPSDLGAATARSSRSDNRPTISPSHIDSTDSRFSVVDDDVDDIEEVQAEIVSVTQHGSVSQMLRGVGTSRQRLTPSLSAQVEKTNDMLWPMVESSPPINGMPQDDRMLAGALARSKPIDKEKSPVTGGSSSPVRDIPLSTGNSGFGRTGKPGIVRKTKPPPLDIDSTKKIDRLSIASIGDLVKRATSSFRGTAAVSHIPNRANEESHVRRSTNKHSSRGMAAARPSRTPVSPDGYDQRPAAVPRNRNRVFGLPWWIFTLIAIGSIITIVVCIVVPLQVTSHQKSPPLPAPQSVGPSQSASATLPSLLAATAASMTPSATTVTLTASECETSLPCENNGVSVVRNNECACICVGDFGGTVCGTVSNNSCAIVAIPDSESSSNVTLGTSIAPLLSNDTAQQFPSVRLDVRRIYQLFNSSGVSCASQNALVTFNGLSRRRDLGGSYGGYRLYLRASSSDDGDASFNLTDTVLKFARVVVLDVAQTNKSVDDAVTFQENLQDAFTDDLVDPDTGVFDAGSGVWVNFLNFTVGGIRT